MTKKIEQLEKKLEKTKDRNKKTDILLEIVSLQQKNLEKEYQLLGTKFIK